MTSKNSTRLILLASLGFGLFLCELLTKPAIGADREENVRWRHEGLLIDDRDVAFIKTHLDEEPWKSAWEKLQGDESLLGMVVRRQISGDEGLDKKIISKVFPSKSGLSQSLIFQYSLAYEIMRNSQSVNEVFLKEWHDCIVSHYDPTSSILDFKLMNIQELSIGVINENDRHFSNGEKGFMEFIQSLFDENGKCKILQLGSKTAVPNLESDLWAISCLLVMAEINAHHGDIFYGNDLYHYSIGHKNLYRICSALFHRIKEEKADPEHWGWLELAYKTYGDPEWLPELKKRRPIFDEWAGGPVTLTHGRVYSAQPPDFGIAEDGFHWLYNFKDLTGWQMSARWYDIDPNDFFVEDGVIRTKGARDHWLMTDRMYDLFHLKLEYQIGQGSNSGILIWAPVPGRPSKCGFEVQLMDDAGKAPAKDGSGALYEVFAPTVNAQKPAGEWNTMEIICSDPRLRVFLNGTMVQDINLNDDPKTQGRRRHGFIGLQDHAHKVAFRNVRVKVLEEGQGFE